MPKLNKCWYNECDSNNKVGPKLLYYKFPKDAERCEQWINNCNNQELNEIWRCDPSKVSKLRICQKHFLREFLGSSSRLVGHAVPAPHGVPLDQINCEKFMMECANLKSSSSILNRQLETRQLANLADSSQTYLNEPIADMNIINQESYDTFGQQLIKDTLASTTTAQHPPQPGLLMTVDQSNHSQLVINSNDNNTFYDESCRLDYYARSSSGEQLNANVDTNNCLVSASLGNNSQLVPYQSTDPITSNTYTSLVNLSEPNEQIRNTDPKIDYDCNGKIVSFHYHPETTTMLKTEVDEQSQAPIIALKHKIRYYQRKLAVINHRYQKLRGQIKGRSNKMRLLECLKICRGDFDPCIFDIFKRQIKGPVSKHGNRWSIEVKTFSSSIYLRSRSAYRLIRRKIDLPSESIVKRYISEKKISKIPEEEEEEVSDDDDDDDNTCDVESDKDEMSDSDFEEEDLDENKFVTPRQPS